MARPRLRLVLAVSLDGRLAPAEGGAAQLGGPGDRRRLEEALAWADAVLLGARTLRLHGTSCLIHASDLLGQRRRMGRPPQPPVMVWSRFGAIPADLPFFHQPFERWLLSAATNISPSAKWSGFDKLLQFDDWPRVLERLGDLGLRRVAVLGGAQLAGALVAARVLDELQLTVCPTLLGGEHLWLPVNAWSDPRERWALVEQAPLEGGDHLMRYVRQAIP